MITLATAPDGAPWIAGGDQEAVLHGMGAWTLRWQDDGSLEIEPDIKLDGYSAALAAYVPPLVISKRQILLFLLSQGKTEDDVVSAIKSIPDDTLSKRALIEWTYPDGGMLHRINPLFDHIGPAIGIETAAAMTSAFRAAMLL